MKEYNPFGLNQQETTHETDTSKSAPHFTEQAGSSPFSETQHDHRASYNAEQGQFPQFQDTATGNTFSRDWQKAVDSMSEIDNLAKKIEAAKNNGWGNQIGKFFGLSRKRLAFIAVAALFILGGMYTFNNKGDLKLPVSASIFSEKISQNTGGEKDTNQLVQELDLILGEVKDIDENGSFTTKTAAAGEGITHLSRYAIKDYLESIGKSLSAEQKIYAEDYVQNKMGSEMLEIGDSLSFSDELLKDAVNAAEGLEDWQIENLSQYVSSASLL